ncbi:MAG: hypothetical protein ACYDCC_07860 [Actinomycetota bacterium]
MPEVRIAVELCLDVNDEVDPLELERAIGAEGRRAARELYVAAVSEIDKRTEGTGRQRLEQRWAATTFGRIRFARYRVNAFGGSSHPTDVVLGLAQSEASPALREMVCDLSLRLPYRQAAEVVGMLTGEPFGHLSAWRVLQQEGARVRTEEGRLVASVFELGEAPPEHDAPSIVVVEADGTFLRAQREGQPKFEVKTGVFYDGKAPAGGRRHRRRKLLNKGCFATTADSDAFGKGLATKGFHWVGLHRASHVLCAHDGLDEYGQTFRDWFPHAIHQVDHFHVAERLWLLCGSDRTLYKRLRKRAFKDPLRFARWVRAGGIAHKDAEEFAGYLERAAPDLYGIDRVPAHLRRGHMRIVGSGVVEKHQDLLVARRMKRRGMRWTRRGADHVLALQGLRMSGRWPTQWGVVPA